MNAAGRLTTGYIGSKAAPNRPTRLHGTPLYAALLEDEWDACAAVLNAGGRLSADEARDPAATAALRDLFNREPGLRSAPSTR